MKVVNIMNFVRQIDERFENSTEELFSFTKEQLRIVNEYGVDNTFLLQYDTICNEDFVNLFKSEATEKTELGIWYEIAEPLTTACNIPYLSEFGWKWDWHIIPGFSMAYTPDERERLIDEAMRKFKEVFGYYPKTVASWIIDTHTLNYLYEHYDICAVGICRDQANTDAYTLLGGYFNQAYYPSKNNIFTPAQSKDMQTNVPVFRLLGPCPIHNYDNNKYSSPALASLGHKSACFTLEPVWFMGSDYDATSWMFDSYYGEESLGFAYSQIGQENSFFGSSEQIFRGLRMQIEMLLKRGDVEFQKMGETGRLFLERYPDLTPATSVVALNNFDSEDVQSVYYDSKNYTANLFRFEDKIFFRSLFLFDDRVEDIYMVDTCKTFDAIYENLPIVDTMTCPDEERKNSGLEFLAPIASFKAERAGEGTLRVDFGESTVIFYEDRIEIISEKLLLHGGSVGKASKKIGECGLYYEYKGTKYTLEVLGAEVTPSGDDILILPNAEKITLIPKKI